MNLTEINGVIIDLSHRNNPAVEGIFCSIRGRLQSRIRKKGEDCDNPNPCDCYVVEYRGKLMWTNPNWG